MRRYVTEALPLGKEAVAAALADAGLAADEPGLLAVVSCTGYVTPGLDIRWPPTSAMAPDVQRLVVGHMGCYAAMPGLGAVADYVTARGRPAVAAVPASSPRCTCSRPPTTPAGSTLDRSCRTPCSGTPPRRSSWCPGAPRPGGLEVVEVAALTDPATADHMTWDVTDLGFRMGLSPEVPRGAGPPRPGRRGRTCWRGTG